MGSVTCVKLALKVGGAQASQQEVKSSTPVKSCTQPKDHMKNFAFATDASGVTTISGSLDEDLQKMAVAVDLNIKIPLIKLPEIALKVPISYSPGIKKGDVKATFGPSTSRMANIAKIAVDVEGTVKLNDGNAEEVVCINITSASTREDPVIV